MKEVVFLISLFSLCCSSLSLKAQQTIEWSPDYQLQFSDFHSSATRIGGVSVVSLHTASEIGFSFHMSNYEFMFTKNFNSKVNCSFDPQSAIILAPDSATAFRLLDFARYEFDLSELYARKFRKKLYEQKGAFSSVNFFHPVYDTIQKEFAARDAQARVKTHMGTDTVALHQLHARVLAEIKQLSDFCKSCKPKKNKKRRHHRK